EGYIDLDWPLKIPLSIDRNILFNLMSKRTSSYIEDLKTKEEVKKIINNYSEKLEEITNSEEKLKKQKALSFLENSIKEFKNSVSKQEGNFRIELRALNPTDDEHIKKTFEKIPEREIFELIEKVSDDHLFLNLCGFLYLDKKKYSFKHGFKLGQELNFPKDVSDQIGSAKISDISLMINDSPLGIERLEFGVHDESLKLNIALGFKIDTIANIMEKIKVFFEVIKIFFMEV
ncbi:hypothetical protein LCGC14_1732300, partial [marine sediment metagenome]